MESARAEGQAPHGEDVASTTECTGLTPTEPEDLEEAYALGELYAVHTLRPNDGSPHSESSIHLTPFATRRSGSRK